MGGVYRVFVEIRVNETKKKVWGELLRVSFCHNWAGDDWFIRLRFKNKETDRIYHEGNYGKYEVFESVVRRFVKEFVLDGKRATFKRINEIVKEICGEKPKWFECS
ncbi:MAG TPA: hypothetical protein ENF95_00630 [Candidatus Aenigmarchaeota archaeon]|nr:hypothetical protein [Candidatus Aenigmarchaeota archaeon]